MALLTTSAHGVQSSFRWAATADASPAAKILMECASTRRAAARCIAAHTALAQSVWTSRPKPLLRGCPAVVGMPVSFGGGSSDATASADESFASVTPAREDSMGGTTQAMSLGRKMLKKQRFSTDGELHPTESFNKGAMAEGPSMRTMRRKSRATVAQARFAARMAQKMSDRRADQVTIRKDQRLLAVAVGGIALMVVDSLLLLQWPEHYSWVGPCLRAVLSFNCVVLVALLWDYYNLLFTRASGDYPPSQQHFWLVTHLRRRFLVEASLAIIHAPPTAFPVEVLPNPNYTQPRPQKPSRFTSHPSPLTASLPPLLPLARCRGRASVG